MQLLKGKIALDRFCRWYERSGYKSLQGGDEGSGTECAKVSET